MNLSDLGKSIMFTQEKPAVEEEKGDSTSKNV
jgi:hypothetical protein